MDEGKRVEKEQWGKGMSEGGGRERGGKRGESGRGNQR